ncbi:MAG TPA: hypothetical protein VF657_14930 [Actinoplanes sp.]
MAFKDYAANLEPTFRPLLGISERLLAATALARDSITDSTVADDLPALLADFPQATALRESAHGRTVTGAAGSIARRLADRIDSVESPRLAVTDQRLLICDVENVSQRLTGWQRWFAPAEMVARQVHTVPREAVLGAVLASAGRQRRGHLVVGFADGSGCVLVCAPPSLAEQTVQALSGG